MRLRELAAEKRRYGYRRLHWLLRREGVCVNHKCVERIYLYERFAAEIAMLFPFFKGVWDTLVNAPSGYIKDDILQFNQSFDSIASL